MAPAPGGNRSNADCAEISSAVTAPFQPLADIFPANSTATIASSAPFRAASRRKVTIRLSRMFSTLVELTAVASWVHCDSVSTSRARPAVWTMVAVTEFVSAADS